jgi:catechol 2,3-dioxygenase-like lactoylglutathione lyase family enzyme
MATLDHIVINVHDVAASVDFYASILGFTLEGSDGPFTVMRVSPDLQILLAPGGAPGPGHYAFALSRIEFGQVFDRIRSAGIEFGPTFDSVGPDAGAGPGEESGARGMAPTLYFRDPSRHLLEIRTYE